MGYRHKKEGALSLLPFLIFIVIYLGAGIYFQIHGVEMAFYQFPSVTAMFIAVLSAFFMGDETLQVKFGIFSRGAGNENVMTMLMIYILAGAFSAVAAAMGGRDATVNLGISFVPAQYLTAGIFIISAFMGTATGTSMGTIAAIVPIAAGISVKSGISEALMVAACVGGAMFGDNLSMISDTTIAATRTQGCELKDKFKMNFRIALPAAVLTIFLLLVIGQPSAAADLQELDYSLLKVFPYIAVLGLALLGANVFTHCRNIPCRIYRHGIGGAYGYYFRTEYLERLYGDGGSLFPCSFLRRYFGNDRLLWRYRMAYFQTAQNDQRE